MSTYQMYYYKNPDDGKVFAYDEQQIEEGWVENGLVPMSDDEVAAHINPVHDPLTHDEVERLRLTAYADPVTGSDRYFAEAVRLQAMGGTQADIDTAKSAGAARYAEIQALYPWPA